MPIIKSLEELSELLKPYTFQNGIFARHPSHPLNIYNFIYIER